jgi:hypothetical protein
MCPVTRFRSLFPPIILSGRPAGGEPKILGPGMSELPVRKYVNVWIKKRKNRVGQGGKQDFSYTLQ